MQLDLFYGYSNVTEVELYNYLASDNSIIPDGFITSFVDNYVNCLNIPTIKQSEKIVSKHLLDPVPGNNVKYGRNFFKFIADNYDIIPNAEEEVALDLSLDISREALSECMHEAPQGNDANEYNVYIQYASDDDVIMNQNNKVKYFNVGWLIDSSFRTKWQTYTLPNDKLQTDILDKLYDDLYFDMDTKADNFGMHLYIGR